MEPVRISCVGDGTLIQIMKIAFANDTIYGYASGASVVGGAERQQWLLARALAATGWSVTVGVHEALEAGERIHRGPRSDDRRGRPRRGAAAEVACAWVTAAISVGVVSR